nr:MAG TPA: hypothetical protein [Caudoviricetes sp.]DAM49591.1 MAG TPA: hypothetical protein [Caudoviricetes sp.]
MLRQACKRLACHQSESRPYTGSFERLNRLLRSSV